MEKVEIIWKDGRRETIIPINAIQELVSGELKEEMANEKIVLDIPQQWLFMDVERLKDSLGGESINPVPNRNLKELINYTEALIATAKENGVNISGVSVEDPIKGPISALIEDDEKLSMKYDLMDNTEIDNFLAALGDDIPTNREDIIIQAFPPPVAQKILNNENLSTDIGVLRRALGELINEKLSESKDRAMKILNARAKLYENYHKQISMLKNVGKVYLHISHHHDIVLLPPTSDFVLPWYGIKENEVSKYYDSLILTPPLTVQREYVTSPDEDSPYDVMRTWTSEHVVGIVIYNDFYKEVILKCLKK